MSNEQERIDRLLTSLAEVRSALFPFAVLDVPKSIDDDVVVQLIAIGRPVQVEIRIGDLRTAQAVMLKQGAIGPDDIA
jgi:hypothetical protein